MKTKLKYLVALLIGAALMFIANRWLVDDTEHLATTADNKRAKPLYWVAPMDSNYRRDEPGLSPMGWSWCLYMQTLKTTAQVL